MLVLSSGSNPLHSYVTPKRKHRALEENSVKRICKRNTDIARLSKKVALKMSGDAR